MGPPLKKKPATSVAGLLSLLSEGLLSQSREPNMLGYIPHSKQVAFHSATEHKRLYIGGNQSGKTTGGIIEDLYWITKRHPYRRIPQEARIDGRAIAVDFDTVKQVFIKQMKRWIIPSDLINGSWEDSYNSVERMLTLDNGGTLQFKSYDQDILQHAGVPLHFIHFDEPPPKGIFQENQVRLVSKYDVFPGSGSWWMTYTPIFGMDWTYDEIYLPGKGGLSDIAVIEVDMTDNPYLSPQAIEMVLNGLSEDEKIARKHGRYVQLGGNIFKEFSSAHVINEADLVEFFWRDGKLPEGWLLYTSTDHGLNAPTATYWHAVGPDNTVITFHEHYKSEMLVKDHAAVMLAYEKELGREPDFRTGDPAIKQRQAVTGTSIQQEYALNGIYISVDSVPKDGSIGITKMRQHMRINPKTKRPYWQILDCPNLVRELQRLHWKTFTSLKNRDSNNPLEQVHKKDDHAFDSCKYFFTFMPELAPEVTNGIRGSDFVEIGSLAMALLEGPVGSVPGPIKWNIREVESLDEYGLEDSD